MQRWLSQRIRWKHGGSHIIGLALLARLESVSEQMLGTLGIHHRTALRVWLDDRTRHISTLVIVDCRRSPNVFNPLRHDTT